MTAKPTKKTKKRQHHLLIAGTGRAGTTFLVRYLTAMGLDTHLSRRGERAWTDEQAQAGLEDFPVGPNLEDLPYVVKTPMLYEFIDQVLENPDIQVDGAIIPIRNLREAASSRIILERRAMYASQPWLAHMEKTWGASAIVPGGIVYSLRAIDEARILAMGFHVLIEHLVHADIKLIFIDFPRMIHDGDYLFATLASFLPVGSTAMAAGIAHAELAVPEKVRIERELAVINESAAIAEQSLDEGLDRLALRRELIRLREELQAQRDG